jgi:oxygen-independent coproporphyrinogen-3 oxidase
LERRQLIRDVMCRFQTRFDPRRYPLEWEHLLGLARDGLVWLEAKDGIAHLEVRREGRWLLRTIAAVFDPHQRLAARGAQTRPIRACWQAVRAPFTGRLPWPG